MNALRIFLKQYLRLAVDLLNELQSTVAASAGAACHSSTDNVFSVSSVLKAMQVSERDALGTLRLSLGRFTTGLLTG